MIRVILVGDESKEVLAHAAIPKALALAAEKLSSNVRHEWLPTEQITSPKSVVEKRPDAIWCVPGSPYRNMEGALTSIQFARENKIPFLGTCGGFQHAVIEYARNVLNLPDADHAESNPAAKIPLISELACAIVNKTETIALAKPGRLARIYGGDVTLNNGKRVEIVEAYQCRYGLNPKFRFEFEDTPFCFDAYTSNGEVRAFELTTHPFYFGTLFQPERSAATGVAHPLITEFVKAAGEFNAGILEK